MLELLFEKIQLLVDGLSVDTWLVAGLRLSLRRDLSRASLFVGFGSFGGELQRLLVQNLLFRARKLCRLLRLLAWLLESLWRCVLRLARKRVGLVR